MTKQTRLYSATESHFLPKFNFLTSRYFREFVVAWHNLVYPQTSGYLLINRIEGQRFVLPLFEDGFESGNTAAWSDTVP